MQLVHDYWARTFVSLAVRNYRLYFWSQMISMAGNWVQMIAQAWLVLQLTNSGALLGLTTGMQFLPTLLLGPWVGMVIDRVPRRTLLYGIQCLGILGSSLLGLAVALDIVALWMVLTLCLVSGVATAFELSARQKFITEIVTDDHLQNAITLSSLEASVARIVGPALGAFCIASISLAGCFFFNAATFAAALVGLTLMHKAEFETTEVLRTTKGYLKEAIRYLTYHHTPRIILVMMISVGVFACEFFITLPLLAQETFGGNASTYALLTTAMGMGAVIGGFYAAGRPHVKNVTSIAWRTVLFGVSMVLLGAMPTLQAALMAAVIVGFLQALLVTAANTLLLSSVVPQMRARMSVMWAVIFAGSTPFGGPLMGWISQIMSPGMAIAVGGITCIASGAIVLARRAATYREHVVVPEVINN
jgi:MFS family permease